jgi:hypothetical protein
MVRHYYLRKEPWQAEVQVQLLDKGDRDRTSHEIAVETRQMLKSLTEGNGAKISVVEMPPGPPVLQSVVAEVHGPQPEVRRQVAQDLTRLFEKTESLRDVDNYMRDPYQYWRFTVDTEKAVRRGISVDTINRNLGMALGGSPLGDVKQRAGHEPVNIMMQVPLAERSEITRLGDLPIPTKSGVNVPLRELGMFEQVWEDPIIYHKDLRDVEYVVAEVGGKLAAPVYGMMQVQDLLKENEYVAPDGVAVDAHWLGAPSNDSTTAIEWAGEWTVTYETFRDMGAAFAVALVLIYILVVWEFGNFRIPALIMAPIPLTLLGIIPAHLVFFQMGWGGEFTATSMIGWIALAGIIVRNSILLVDFSIHQIQQGTSVVESVIMACKTRTRPIMITAFALVCGSSVIFFDPIFQGMAISLASGVMVSTVLTLIVIPLGCIAASKDLIEVAAATAPEGSELAVNGIPTEMPEVSEPVLAVEETGQAKGASLPGKVWAGLIGFVMMLFYLVRGLFLLLFRRKPAAVGSAHNQPADAPPPPTASGASGAGSAGAPPASGQTGSSGSPPAVAASGLSEPTPAQAVEAEREAPPPVDAEPESPPATGKTQAQPTELASEAEETMRPQVRESVQPEVTAAQTGPKPKKRPSALKKKSVKKKASPSKSAASSGKSRKKTAPGNGGEQPKPATSENAGHKSVSNVTNFPLKKRASRRGIRLK